MYIAGCKLGLVGDLRSVRPQGRIQESGCRIQGKNCPDYRQPFLNSESWPPYPALLNPTFEEPQAQTAAFASRLGILNPVLDTPLALS
jgi:hypothetical protein